MATRWNMAVIASLALPIACNSGGKDDDSGKPPATGDNDPVADAGHDQAVPAATSVALDGCGSYDPDGDPITFSWGFDHTPAGSALATAKNPFPQNYTTACETSFNPDLTGTYVVKLVVMDNRGAESAADYVVVTVDGGTQPVANAGVDQSGLVSAEYTLDGTGSYDGSKRPLTYGWAMTNQPKGSSATLSGADTVAPTFTADEPGLYTVALVVDNGILVSDPDTVNVTATVPDPTAPVANAGQDVTAEDCTAIPLDGSASTDPDGSTLIYSWALQTKPATSSATNDAIANRGAEITTFYPDVSGDFTLSLAVFDGKTWSVPDTISLHVIERVNNTVPQVYAGLDQNFSAGTAECTNGTYGYECDECPAIKELLGSDASVIDDESDPYGLLWEVIGGEATIDDPYVLTTEVEMAGSAPSDPGDCVETFFTFRLTATDCPQTSSFDEVTFDVMCCGVEKP